MTRSTPFTRCAGLAAIATPWLFVVVVGGSLWLHSGFVQSAAYTLIEVPFMVYAFALLGIARRHGGLGPTANAAILSTVVTLYVLSDRGFSWQISLRSGVMIVTTIVGIAALDARILPARALALFTIAPAVGWIAMTGYPTGVDPVAGMVAGFGLYGAFALGLSWIGWTLLRGR